MKSVCRLRASGSDPAGPPNQPAPTSAASVVVTSGAAPTKAHAGKPLWCPPPRCGAGAPRPEGASRDWARQQLAAQLWGRGSAPSHGGTPPLNTPALQARAQGPTTTTQLSTKVPAGLVPYLSSIKNHTQSKKEVKACHLALRGQPLFSTSASPSRLLSFLDEHFEHSWAPSGTRGPPDGAAPHCQGLHRPDIALLLAVSNSVFRKHRD